MTIRNGKAIDSLKSRLSFGSADEKSESQSRSEQAEDVIIEPGESVLFPVSEYGKWAYINKAGTVVISQ